jgi:predicted small metal-binding protein
MPAMSTSTGGDGEMTVLVITCDCGYVIRGDIEVELIANCRNHIDEAHPDRADRTDEDLLSRAERQSIG